MDKRKIELFKWCPSCEKEEIVFDKEPKVAYLGMDALGHGQPVRFSECDCGKSYGWLCLGHYDDDIKYEYFFLSYLKHRIKFYYRD